MLLYKGAGAPLMPTIANALASRGLRGIYTVIMLITYIPISLLVVGIIVGLKKITHIFLNKNKEKEEITYNES